MIFRIFQNILSRLLNISSDDGDWGEDANLNTTILPIKKTSNMLQLWENMELEDFINFMEDNIGEYNPDKKLNVFKQPIKDKFPGFTDADFNEMYRTINIKYDKIGAMTKDEVIYYIESIYKTGNIPGKTSTEESVEKIYDANSLPEQPIHSPDNPELYTRPGLSQDIENTKETDENNSSQQPSSEISISSSINPGDESDESEDLDDEMDIYGNIENKETIISSKPVEKYYWT